MARTEPRAEELTQRLPTQPPWQERTERMPAQAPPEAAVAARPALAPGVTLSGDMEESAFVEPQWLVQREGKFVQLTELLYRVVENVDGQRTLEEIAEQVGDAIDRDVTAENVRQLIGQKLIDRLERANPDVAVAHRVAVVLQLERAGGAVRVVEAHRLGHARGGEHPRVEGHRRVDVGDLEGQVVQHAGDASGSAAVVARATWCRR